MKRVLQAYSAYDSGVSYQQGIGFIAGTLMTQMPEEAAFWTLVTIMFNHDWRQLFTEETPKLVYLVNVLEQMIKKTLNDIYQHLDREGIIIHGAFAHYFISIITYNAPLALSCKVIDLFLYKGHKVLFDIILKALRSNQHKILQMKDEMLNKYLRQEILNDMALEKLY